jgi:hypothetical protein
VDRCGFVARRQIMSYGCKTGALARRPLWMETIVTTTIQHARSILAAEHHARETIPDGIGAWDDECPKRIATVRKDFQAFIRFADNRNESLKADLDEWRSQVVSGDKEFDHDEEAGYKQALSALISFAELLDEKYETYRQRGINLHKSGVIGILLERKKWSEKMLRDWKSPEWEVIGMRAVKWDKEQTRHLMNRLSSCE